MHKMLISRILRITMKAKVRIFIGKNFQKYFMIDLKLNSTKSHQNNRRESSIKVRKESLKRNKVLIKIDVYSTRWKQVYKFVST